LLKSEKKIPSQSSPLQGGDREEGRGKSDFKSHYVEQFLKRNEEE